MVRDHPKFTHLRWSYDVVRPALYVHLLSPANINGHAEPGGITDNCGVLHICMSMQHIVTLISEFVYSHILGVSYELTLYILYSHICATAITCILLLHNIQHLCCLDCNNYSFLSGTCIFHFETQYKTEWTEIRA
jgi:hypothetical protein